MKYNKTITVQIGNTDDKLPQRIWCDFCHTLKKELGAFGQFHFAAGSPSDAEWQNYCIVMVPSGTWGKCHTQDEVIGRIGEVLAIIADRFDQDSIALTIGETEFVG